MKVVITGVSRGIGKATAQKFLKEGWEVFGTSTSGKVDWNNDNLHVYRLDLSNLKSISEFVEKIIKDTDKLDVLINNAGMQLAEDFISADGLRKTLEVNLIDPTDITLRLMPIINKGSHIIFVSSGLGSLQEGTGAYEPTYSISKTAVNKLMKVFASALGDKDITVSSVDPGWVKTDMGGDSAPRKPEEPADEIYKMATSKLQSGFFWYQNRKRTW